MKSDIATLSNYDGFSWKRVRMIGRYYNPGLRRMIAAFFAISLFTSLFIIILPHKTLTWQWLNQVLGYCAIFGCTVFLSRRDQEVFTSLPALTSEKFAFFIINIFVIIPLACGLLPTVAAHISGVQDQIYSELNSEVRAAGFDRDFLTSGTIAFGLLISILTNWAAALTVLWAGWTAKRNRIGKGILMYIVSIIAIGLIVGIYAIYAGFSEAVSLGADNIEKSSFITSIINSSFSVMFVLLFAYLGFALVMFYRSLANRQC